MKRYGSVIQLHPEKVEQYKQLHSAAWPEVLIQIRKSNIRNYSIFYRDGWLFSYFEYVGLNYESDMANMAEHKITQEWWAICKPCQLPLDSRLEGEWWANMEEVFHTD